MDRLLRITSAEFFVSVAYAPGKSGPAQFPKTDQPEVVFLGRSNVGKSSLINKLSSRRNLARISQTPGKTREINYYLLNKKFYFVDLPGYGYAKVPEQMRASWGKLIEYYLQKRKQIRLAIQVVDARHGLTELDKMMVDWLEYYEIPYLVVLTKADKIARSKLPLHLQAVKENFHDHTYCREIIPFSALTDLGKDEVLRVLEAHLANSSPQSLVA
ncbi:MAG: ribosome biogenesis GTP-binding protein YihA/YsxC [Bacteroidota bacterium]